MLCVFFFSLLSTPIILTTTSCNFNSTAALLLCRAHRYAALAVRPTAGLEDWISDCFIQARLNSPDRLERYLGLLCVGRLKGTKVEGIDKLKKEVLPKIAQTELISDVRDLAMMLITEKDEAGCLERACLPVTVKSDSRRKLISSELQTLKDSFRASVKSTS